MEGVFGIVGAGQLGKKTIEKAHSMDYKVVVLSDKHGCAIDIADDYVIGPYEDKGTLERFAAKLGGSVVTCEFESVPFFALQYLARLGQFPRPLPNAFAIAQDRSQEKNLMNVLRIPTTNYISLDHLAVATDYQMYFPGVFKTCWGGYDGKGQHRIRSREEALEVWRDQYKRAPCVLERHVKFDYEISVIVARNQAGEFLVFPAVKNKHCGGILRETHYKAGLIPDRIVRIATEYAKHIAEGLGLVGLLAVEFFVVGDQVLVNEIAPRPHNSGHWTIEACKTSQFEALIRAILDLPFPVSVEPLAEEAVMINLIGDEINEIDSYKQADWDVHTHNYGKGEASPGRKMGHITRIRRHESVLA